jgi:ribonuclease H2 subunit A
MVYSVFYLPLTLERGLLAETHHFDDSKVLTPETRSRLMQSLCTSETDLFANCGWATRLLSARSISAGMLQPLGAYNLNAQAMDATVDLIKGVLDLGVNVTDVFIDTIGNPEAYQRRLEKIFPSQRITVAKKADSLYPCVSAASVCAKVTRDAALEVNAEHLVSGHVVANWGSGYPSDARCINWLKSSMDPVFGWGAECRFSWGTAKDLLEVKNKSVRVDWPADESNDGMKMTAFFSSTDDETGDELASWYGRRVAEEVF